jgi:hypothetical protein
VGRQTIRLNFLSSSNNGVKTIMTEIAKAPPSVFGNERNEPHCFDGATEIYIRGPGWPSTVNVNDAPANPWSKQHWNLTGQAQIFKRDQDEANRLARAAGHKDALSARIANAK